MNEALRSDYKFKPIRGLEADILGVDGVGGVPHTEGALLIATDTGRMWFDTPRNRIALGGSGASLLYASATAQERADDDGEYSYVIDRTELDNADVKPQVDDLILNSDGSFYRITSIDGDDLICARLAVSGNGSGPGNVSGSRAMTIKGKPMATATLVNGQDADVKFTVTSALDANGEVEDEELVVTWALIVTSTGNKYDGGTFKVKSGVEHTFQFGQKLRPSVGSTLTIYATGANSGKSKVISYEMTTVELLLYESEKFNNLAPYGSTFTMYCNVAGNIEKIIEFLIDGEVVGTKQLAKSATGEQSLTVNNIPHGTHLVTIDLYQSVDGEKGEKVKTPLEFEIAVNDGVTKDPLIWVGDYAKTFYNYDAIKIPFRVFDPANEDVTVNFVKGITVIGHRVEKSSATKFSYWQITDAKDIGILNTYSIQVAQNITDDQGNVISTKMFAKEVQFTVEQDPDRNLVLVSPESLMLKFDAAGRSNNDSESIRTAWSYVDTTGGVAKTYNAKFENFNWNNNGWVLDANNDVCLRISNGAKFSIPIGNMVMNNSANTAQQSKTFEFEFKVRNVQNYSNLIKEYTRYAGDKEYWDAFVDQMEDENGYDNYDNYLKYLSSLPGYPDYDKMTETFSDITRLVASSTPFCQYYDASGHGLCLGPQDGFFSSAQNTLNVKYVEDQLINLSIVFNYNDKRLYMYLQGVLTAVCKITDSSALEIAANNIVFNSEYCDVDLYKFRIYNSALSVRDILLNYSVDHSSITDYDHTTKLISYNRDTGEYQLDYSLVKAWNRGDDEDGDAVNRPDYLMPYVIWYTGSKSAKLPYSKADEKQVGMTFVNTALDYAFKTGELEDLANEMTDDEKNAAEKEGLTNAQYYYKHHCPSWISDGTTVALAVQGTSSEFYPRRNYKAKPKDSDDVVHMFMNRGPFADDYNTFLTKYSLKVPKLADDKSNQLEVDEAQALYNKVHLEWFYFNNSTYGANKFTMKIDFMESSGTYNMGLANLVHSSYAKHPIDDYNKVGMFNKKVYNKDLAATATPKAKYYADAKGKTEVKFEGGVVYEPNKYYKLEYEPTTINDTDKLRTNAQGFPVMAFWQYGEKDSDFQFLGRYNYLSDKGSDETYGFKTDKSITNKFVGNKNARDIAECWEYSDNARGFCSFRDPKGRHKLNFDVYTSELATALQADGYEKALEEAPVDGVDYFSFNEETNEYTKVTFSDEVVYAADTFFKEKMVEVPTIKKIRQYNSKNSCPFVADSFEYRYNKKKDFLDYIYNPAAVKTDDYNALLEDYTATQLADIGYRSEQLFKLYANWEKACQWVWSTCIDNVPTEADRASGKATARKIMTYAKADPATTTFNAAGTYYDENEDLVVSPNETMFKLGAYYIGTPITKQFEEGGTVYEYETKEYRLAKFTNELQDHFDLEYLLVYFIITEVLLCYDSRGKNCMMASWGPQKADGDYIWYPIFYDMDTQLGINNTGIPSFEYSEDATIDGTFSTSDSILWNNLYACFFDNIQAKYTDLRHTLSNSRYSGPGPLADVPHIEKWYLADPDETHEIEMRGARPLAMFNMDEQFKYISICNPAIQYQNRQGGMSTDTNGEFFYALQGNRSLSRQQFLARRLNFVDSWLSQGNYSRSDGTSIEGRIGANNFNLYSDKWINQANASADAVGFEVAPYYTYQKDGVTPVNDERGYPKKNQYLDADFFVELTPYQKSYVSLGLDNESFPSVEYSDKEVRYEFPESNKAGIMNSPKLKESLIYIYGADALSDMGDVSTLYWSQFKANHAPHLQRLLLGNDHPDFYNRGLSSPGFDASADSDWGKPLLKEVNLSGLTLSTDGLTDFDFTSSEKLQIFKAVRSNITSVKFANGVALHTLYLPGTITSLALTKAANLNTMITHLKTDFNPETYTDPEQNTYYSTYYPATNTWVADRGLYIANVTDFDENTVTSSTECALAQIEIEGGVLGYASYDLLHKLYTIYRHGKGDGAKELKISMVDVDWSPYKKLDKDTPKKDDGKYFTDDGHYGFKEYTYVNENQWKLDLINGEVYELNETELAEQANKIVDIDMFLDFINRTQFKNTTSTGASTPVITGSVFINNPEDKPIDENIIRNTLLLDSAFPGKKLDIHFANVKKGYSAKFVQMEADGTYEVLGTQVIASNAALTTRFGNPYSLYTASRDNYDFWGWSTTNDRTGVIEENQWDTSEKAELVAGQTEYVFYAIFTRHEFTMEFKVGTPTTGFVDACAPVGTLYGDYIVPPSVMPGLDESSLEATQRYKFLGWGQDRNAVIAASENKAKVVNVSKIQATDNLTFYAVFCEESVYNSVTDEKYFKFNTTSYVNLFTGETVRGVEVGLNLYDAERNPTGYTQTALSGKITIPSWHDNDPVIRVAASGFSNCTNITHVFFEKNNANGPCQVKMFDEYCFNACSKLQHIELPESLERLRLYCLANTPSLILTTIGGNINHIEHHAFQNAFANYTDDLYLGGNIRYIEYKAFLNMGMTVSTLYIGSKELNEPSQLSNSGGYNFDYVGTSGAFFNPGSGRAPGSLSIYCSASDREFFNRLFNERYIVVSDNCNAINFVS